MLTSTSKPVPADGPSENAGDLNAMFDAINNLPADDPLHAAASTGDGAASSTSVAAGVAPASPAASTKARPSRIMSLLPAKVVAAFAANGGTSSVMSGAATGAAASLRASPPSPKVEPHAIGAVVVDAGRRVAVPSFAGSGLRNVVETSAALGLRLDPVGSGIARDQAPAAGTMVPLGTEVVVRFAR
jgi:cell division protein FtsI (penicillin-binding protein 3)